MKTNQIARDNHAFYYAQVGLAMCSDLFVGAVLNSFDEPAQYGIEHGGNFGGYILIDSTNIKHRRSHGGFADAVREGILGRVAMKIPRSITGTMNTEVTIIDDVWKFSFKITKYERDSEHGFEMIEDPAVLPDEEELSRFVELKITIPSLG